jgi:hypothetical protein
MPPRQFSFSQIVAMSKIASWLKRKKRWKQSATTVQTVNLMTAKYNSAHLRDEIGDAVVITEDQAKQLQWAIEKTFRKKLSFNIRSGDIVLGEFTNLPKVGRAKKASLFSTSRGTHQSVGHSLVRQTLTRPWKDHFKTDLRSDIIFSKTI